MESPLSFDSSENFRKKLLVRNLKPYSVDQSFNSSDVPGISDITLIDYSVIDSPSIEEIGQKQEGILYVQNQYAPNDQKELYGNVVNINLNQNTKSNDGIYDFSKTIGSQLETRGNSQEMLLYVNNLYGPNGDDKFGNTVNINENLQTNGNLGEYNLNFTNQSKLELFGNQQEIFLYTNNIYGPQNNNSYGETVDINQNLQLTTNVGEYDFTDSIGSKLESIGNFQEQVLYTNNIYGPSDNTSYGDSVNINQNKQFTANVGEYGPTTATNPKTTDQSRNESYVLNEYGPEDNDGYGTDINPVIESNLQTTSNRGFYDSNIGLYGDDLSLTLTPTPKTPSQYRDDLYVVNEYGPDNIDGYGFDVNPRFGANLQTTSNQGPYNEGASSGPELTSDQSRTFAYVKNEYGPESDNGYGDQINSIIDTNLQTTSNQGEYDYVLSPLPLTSTQSQAEAYGDNKYVNGDGSYEEVTISDLTEIIERTFLPYAESETTFIFVPSIYTPFEILEKQNPQGSDGSLSQDSSLAQLGAERLQKEFKARVALELLQQTVNRVNAFDTSINTDTGNVSVKPNTDPFNAIGIVSGNIPLLARDFTVTRPDLFLGQGINFAAKLAGLYSPYSYIPGEYFDYPKKRLVNQALENPIGAATQAIAGLVNKVTSLNIENGSELFLANTSQATSDLLFEQLSYNPYRPDYRGNSLRDPNLLAPKPIYYIGDRKSLLKSITPINQQPENRFGDITDAAVFGHGGLGTDYETYKERSVGKNFLFGLNSRGYYDGANNPNGTDTGTIYGGFTWGSSDSGTIGKKIGYNNEVYGEAGQDEVLLSGLRGTLAGDYGSFRPDSILDVTNKLVLKSEEASGLYKQRHVGNAISQVSKVFNDGVLELTKGSRVIRYSTPTSKNSENANDVIGYEYCRVFTKDNPYYLYSNLQKTAKNIRGFDNSVLTNTYNLNIAPTSDFNSSTIDYANRKVKKYMFSLENLAWRTSNSPGFTVEDLPVSEIGPNGGRVMWFPPYDLTFSEDVRTNWTDHTFLGRTEPIYTYGSTSRSGSINFKILVDHPSILNTIVKKELAKTSPESKLTKVVDSFFAGCTQYDIYDLLKKFAEFSISDVYAVRQALGDIAPGAGVPETTQETKSGDFSVYFNKVSLFFDNNSPTDDTTSYDTLLTDYKNKINGEYQTRCKNIFINYSNKDYEADNVAQKQDVNFFEDTIDATVAGINDFKKYIESNYDTFNTKLLKDIKDFLKQKEGNILTLEVKGNALPYLSKSDNKKLSEKRFNSLKEYLKKDKDIGKLVDKQFIIVDKSDGNPIFSLNNENNYDKIDCNTPFKGQDADKETGVYSVNAMFCRSLQVTNILLKENNKPNGDNPDSENTSVTPENGIEQKEGTETTPQEIKPQIPPNTRKDIVKRLLRKLLKESDYFEMIQENEPMLYDGIKQKLRHFDPAFHSMTPEGLNSRLTFLQQCMRPGDTIPTVKNVEGETTKLDYSDAFNSAFGAPPICILRIGDFYHTKIVIDSLGFTYDDVAFDLNPEGIGVQPMIVDVKMSFNFIGGQGLREPIEKLQNALSFNYYANTEMYDERADETEPVSDKLTAELIALGQEALGIRTNTTTKPNTDGGDPIGTIVSQIVDPNNSVVTGDIYYEKSFNDYVDTTKNYFNSVIDGLSQINDEFLYGGLILATKERNYVEGTIRGGGTGATETKLFGHNVNLQQKVDTLFEKTNKDVKDDVSPLLEDINTKNFKNSDIRNYKKKIEELLNTKQQDYLSNLKKSLLKSDQEQLKLIKLIDKLSFVSGDKDGYKTSKGVAVIYQISGKTEGGTSNTLVDYKKDMDTIIVDTQKFYSTLYKYNLIPSGTTAEYNENFDFEIPFFPYTNVDTTKPIENRLYMTLGIDIIDKKIDVINNLYSSVEDSDNSTDWKLYIENTVNKLSTKYIKCSGDFAISNNKFINDEFILSIKTNYRKDLTSKKRTMNYSVQTPTNTTDGNNLIKLYQANGTNGPKYNFVKDFRG